MNPRQFHADIYRGNAKLCKNAQVILNEVAEGQVRKGSFEVPGPSIFVRGDVCRIVEPGTNGFDVVIVGDGEEYASFEVKKDNERT